MPKIKNMGTATMRFNEGIIVTGSGDSPLQPALNVYANVSGQYAAIIDNDHGSSGHVLKLLTDGNGVNSRVLEMEDGDGDIIFRARADGRFGFGPDGVSSMGAGTFVVGIDNSSHTSDIAISQRLQHLGDSNTYMEFPSNDNITFAAGGSEELKIASDAILVKQFIKHDGDEDTLINFADNKIILKAGNIALVTAEKKGSAPHEVTINDGSNNVDFVVKGNGSNQGNPGMKFDASTNKLGINGIGTPAYELEVAGDIGLAEYIYHRGDDNTFIRFQNDVLSASAGGVEFVTLEENSSQPSNFFVNKNFSDVDFSVMGQGQQNMDLFYIDASDGNVGIGTQPDSAYKLHISGSTTTYALIGEGGDGHKSTQLAALLLSANKGTQSVTASFGVSSPSGVGSVLLGSESDHDLFLRTGGSTVMTLSASNDVGIGTSSPDSRLHVNDTGGNTIITVGDNTTQNELSEIILKASKHSNSVSAFLAGADTGGGASQLGSVGTISNHDFIIKTNSANRVTVKNSGNVTIEKDLYVLEDLFVTGSFKPGSLVVNHPTFTSATGSILVAKEEYPPAIRLIRSSSVPTTSVNPDDNNTIFGSLTFNSEDNNYFSYVEVAAIEAVADGANWAYNQHRPTAIVFKTGQENSITTSERMRITSEGKLSIGRNKPTYDLHLEDTGSVASFGMIRRHRTFSADDELGIIHFGAVGGDDDGLSVESVAKIVSKAESSWTMPHDEDALSGFMPSGNLTFITRASGSSAANAAILTGDRELQVDTIGALATNADQKIKWRNDLVAVPLGGFQSYNERIDISGSIRYAKFAKSNIQINGTETNISSQPHRVHFNPDNESNFELRVGGNNGLGSDQYFYVSGSAGSKGTATRGTAVFGGDVVVSGSLYDSDGDKYAKSNKVVAYGSITLQKNGGRTVSFDRQTSLGDSAFANVKGFLFAPFNGIVSKIMVMLKSSVDTASHGIITARTFKNSDQLSSANSAIAVSGDNFTQVNASNPTISKGEYSPNLTISEGDLLQFTISRSNDGSAGSTDGVVMITLEEDF